MCTFIHKTPRLSRFTVLGAVIALFGSVPAGAQTLESRPVVATAEARLKAQVLAARESTPALSVRLPRLLAGELSALAEARAREKYSVVGVGRKLAQLENGVALDSLAWNLGANGTRFATIEITSAGAAALRLGVRAKGLPKGLTIVAYGTAHPELIYGPFTIDDLNSPDAEPYWLPATEGETLRLELRTASTVSTDNSRLNLPIVSHLVTSIRTDSWLKDLSDVGRAGQCNIDIACSPSNATWVNRGQGVAKYLLTNALGLTGSCTGTLINSEGASPPNYFITANHCVSTVGASNSMHFYWFFQRAICGGLPPSAPLTETTGGATFIKTVAANDQTLVRLNAGPPVGTILTGWNADPVTDGQALFGIHHPRGDLKKFSVGASAGFTPYANNVVSPSGNHIRVFWNQGTTEGGSSGSAIFNNTGQIVGTLHGGGASCQSLSSPDWYGRFDQAYDTFQAWLSPAGAPPPPDPPPSLPTVDLTSGIPVTDSVAEDEVKWYRIQAGAGNFTLTVTLTGLSADADLYLYRDAQGGVPATCVSQGPTQGQPPNVSESCSRPSNAPTTWYIGVLGFEASSYTVTASLSPTAAPPSGGGGGGGGGGAWSLGIALSMLGLVLLRANLRRMRTTVQ